MDGETSHQHSFNQWVEEITLMLRRRSVTLTFDNLQYLLQHPAYYQTAGYQPVDGFPSKSILAEIFRFDKKASTLSIIVKDRQELEEAILALLINVGEQNKEWAEQFANGLIQTKFISTTFRERIEDWEDILKHVQTNHLPKPEVNFSVRKAEQDLKNRHQKVALAIVAPHPSPQFVPALEEPTPEMATRPSDLALKKRAQKVGKLDHVPGMGGGEDDDGGGDGS